MTSYGSAVRWAIFIVRRLAGAVIAMFGVVVLVFAVSHVLGDPAQIILGPRASAPSSRRCATSSATTGR